MRSIATFATTMALALFFSGCELEGSKIQKVIITQSASAPSKAEFDLVTQPAITLGTNHCAGQQLYLWAIDNDGSAQLIFDGAQWSSSNTNFITVGNCFSNDDSGATDGSPDSVTSCRASTFYDDLGRVAPAKDALTGSTATITAQYLVNSETPLTAEIEVALSDSHNFSALAIYPEEILLTPDSNESILAVLGYLKDGSSDENLASGVTWTFDNISDADADGATDDGLLVHGDYSEEAADDHVKITNAMLTSTATQVIKDDITINATLCVGQANATQGGPAISASRKISATNIPAATTQPDATVAPSNIPRGHKAEFTALINYSDGTTTISRRENPTWTVKSGGVDTEDATISGNVLSPNDNLDSEKLFTVSGEATATDFDGDTDNNKRALTSQAVTVNTAQPKATSANGITITAQNGDPDTIEIMEFSATRIDMQVNYDNDTSFDAVFNDSLTLSAASSPLDSNDPQGADLLRHLGGDQFLAATLSTCDSANFQLGTLTLTHPIPDAGDNEVSKVVNTKVYCASAFTLEDQSITVGVRKIIGNRIQFFATVEFTPVAGSGLTAFKQDVTNYVVWQSSDTGKLAFDLVNSTTGNTNTTSSWATILDDSADATVSAFITEIGKPDGESNFVNGTLTGTLTSY